MCSHPIRTLLCLSLWLGAHAWAVEPQAKVIELTTPDRILVSQKESPWRVGERVCVLHDWEEVACGEIIYSGPNGAEVKLSDMNDSFERGDWVQFAKESPVESDAPASSVAEASPRGRGGSRGKKAQDGVRVPKDYFQFSFNPVASTSFVAAGVHAEVAVGRHWSLGIKFLYADASSEGRTGTGFGLLGSVNYYGRHTFEGLWVQLSTGDFALSSSAGNWNALYASLGLGVRFHMRHRFSLGLQVGPRLMARPPAGTSNDSILHPFINVEFGRSF